MLYVFMYYVFMVCYMYLTYVCYTGICMLVTISSAWFAMTEYAYRYCFPQLEGQDKIDNEKYLLNILHPSLFSP